MLKDDLFTFNELQEEGNMVTTNIKLNPSHPIFKGHFPDQSVLPGVCMMQMVKEVLEVCIKKQTMLTKASDIKFLSVVAPEQDKLIQIELKISAVDDGIRVDARLLDDAAILFKFKGIFKEIA